MSPVLLNQSGAIHFIHPPGGTGNEREPAQNVARAANAANECPAVVGWTTQVQTRCLVRRRPFPFMPIRFIPARSFSRWNA
jgi:hypothetical protein